MSNPEIINPELININTEEDPFKIPKYAITEPESERGEEFWKGVANGSKDLGNYLGKVLELAKQYADAKH